MKVSIVSPTYNEKENVEKLVQRLRALKIESEIIIVDDNSPDGTGDVADKLSRKYKNVRVIHRPGKNGLSSAVIEGFNIATGDILGVTDADLSHEIEKIPAMVKLIEAGKANLVIGSRYMPGGKILNWPLKRRVISKGAIMLSKPLTGVRDSVSGFFFLKKDIIKGVTLNARGYKIGLEVIVKSNHEGKIIEFPYTFSNRNEGKSKLNAKEFSLYLGVLLDLVKYRFRKGKKGRKLHK